MTEDERLEALRRVCGTCAAMQREVNEIDSQVREVREMVAELREECARRPKEEHE